MTMHDSGMEDVILVLNAGSSSLKFAVYRSSGAASWQAECRGQIEGIGTAPRMSARDASDVKLAVPTLDASVADSRAALARLADWLRETFTGKRIAYGANQFNYKKAAEIAARYPVGARPAVYYNPDKPKDSVLETSASGGKLFIILGAIMGAVGLVVLVVSLLT